MSGKYALILGLGFGEFNIYSTGVYKEWELPGLHFISQYFFLCL